MHWLLQRQGISRAGIERWGSLFPKRNILKRETLLEKLFSPVISTMTVPYHHRRRLWSGIKPLKYPSVLHITFNPIPAVSPSWWWFTVCGAGDSLARWAVALLQCTGAWCPMQNVATGGVSSLLAVHQHTESLMSLLSCIRLEYCFFWHYDGSVDLEGQHPWAVDSWETGSFFFDLIMVWDKICRQIHCWFHVWRYCTQAVCPTRLLKQQQNNSSLLLKSVYICISDLVLPSPKRPLWYLKIKLYVK